MKDREVYAYSDYEVSLIELINAKGDEK